MIELKEIEKDEADFIPIVERALNNVLLLTHPDEVYVVKIDGWFDHKWQKFSGTVMHEIAIWRDNLTLPPFHPSRVLSEKCFRATPDLAVYNAVPDKPLHIHQPSSENLGRAIRNVSSSALFVWYSHVSKDSDRASLMVYTVDSSETIGWYAGFARKGGWSLAQVKGISRKAFTELVLAEIPASEQPA